MGFAVYHAEKGKGSGGGLGNHIDRVEGKEHSYRQADETRLSLNVIYDVPKGRKEMPLNEAIADRIKEGYNNKRKIRNDSVKCIKHVLSGSHEDMKRIFADEKTKTQWIDANREFIKKEFGANNLVRFNLHLDEKTPHLHAVTVPLTEDGRMSAKEVMGNKKDLELRQDRYAEMMKPFNLERGLKRTGIKHSDAQEYYARMNKANESGGNIEDLTAKRSVLGIDVGTDKEKTIDNLKGALVAEKRAIKAKDLELKAVKDRLEVTRKSSDINSRNFDAILFNEKTHEKAQNAKIDLLQQKMTTAVKNKVEYQFSLHKADPQKKWDIAINTAKDKAKELGVSPDFYNKAMDRNNFRDELHQIVEKRAEANLERDQSKRNDRGMNM